MLAGIVSLGLLGTNGIHSVEGTNGTCKKTLVDIVVDFFDDNMESDVREEETLNR